jgi:hypothetical protein
LCYGIDQQGQGHHHQQSLNPGGFFRPVQVI